MKKEEEEEEEEAHKQRKTTLHGGSQCIHDAAGSYPGVMRGSRDDQGLGHYPDGGEGQAGEGGAACG